MNSIIVLYEDDDIVAINKPAGLMVHSDGRTKDETLVDWVRARYPAMVGVGEDMVFENGGEEEKIERPGIVHRLDRDTSGVLLLAKHPRAYQFLKHEFADRTIKKKYKALVLGHIRHDSGIIDMPIARSRNDFRRKEVSSIENQKKGLSRGEAREATTLYSVLNRFRSFRGKEECLISYVELFPKSGRTHQLRVHMRHMRHPIINDTLYGPKKGYGLPELPLARLALHAYSITFRTMGGEEKTITAPLPADFEETLSLLA